MKKTKQTATRKECVRVFGRWSLTNEEKWLQKKAAAGWRLCELPAPCVYRFEKAEPVPCTYAVEYAANAADCAEDLAVCCNAGWNYLGRANKRRYFCAETADPTHPSASSTEEGLCLRTAQGNLTTLLLLNLPGTLYCLMYLLIFLGEGGFFFGELFAENTDSWMYLFGALLGIVSISYLLSRLGRIRKRLRRFSAGRDDA